MSELKTAMQAAVDSVDHAGGARRSTTFASRSFLQTLRDEYGPVVSGTVLAVRELVALVLLFWVSAILLAFMFAEQTTVPLVLTVALTVRGALALAQVASPATR